MLPCGVQERTPKRAFRLKTALSGRLPTLLTQVEPTWLSNVRAFLLMKKALTVTICLLVCVLLAGCSTLSPFADIVVSAEPEDTVTVYVSGAVEKTGYYTIAVGETYFFAIEQAGLLPFGYIVDGEKIVRQNQLWIYVGYYLDGGYYDSINVNGVLVTQHLPVANVSDEVVLLLKNYVETNGKIRNNADMKLALGEYYEDNFYKFYVDEVDYEATR